MRECERVRELAPELVRGAENAELKAHAAGCEPCALVLAGARALGRDLALVTSEEPAGDLVERTLARVRIAAALGARESGRLPAAAELPEPIRVPRRRTSVEILATWALPGPRPAAPAPTQRLGLRIAIQAAAAVFLFLLCTGFTVKFYPVVVLALEESRTKACQARLEKVGAALVRYGREHPGAELRGTALRDALLRAGLVSEEDFLCPAVHGARPGALCYFLRLPDGNATRPVAWDRFGNHGGDALNVVNENGKVERLEGERLWAWFAEVRAPR